MKTTNNENTEKENDEKEEIEIQNEPKPAHNFLREEQLTDPNLATVISVLFYI